MQKVKIDDIFTEDPDRVMTSQWKPNHEPLDYPTEFVKWINSMNSGWRNMTYYEPFELYVKQAEQWCREEDEILNYRDEETQEDYIYQEYKRCDDNTLYFANKYGYIKDGDIEGGETRYKAWRAQQIILFLLDCGYNLLLGKVPNWLREEVYNDANDVLSMESKANKGETEGK